ncbi:saccharopine dehydrogenase family protein [Parachitinimonas caeni]|uniref:Saccharopine dehydrogenase NADP-binding domain-containing protein n=1 Tax=Parachitinimonas caeni TaxID=3031301 RepID=A0ABT7DYM3_9NEIS|nr:saccharopine dehydrogenase NADP-binding domain-containing protein [Parachitinimonas caeni]MDK2123762.1 saccharopine dehydrogenase NADP-binding domain-containing protein [Parachitinimonas caeni]
MFPILIVGAGKIGASIAKLLYHSGNYDITVADRDQAALSRLTERVPVKTAVVNMTDTAQLAGVLDGKKAVLSATSFDINPKIAEAALKAGASYFDLTEDVATTRAVRALAETAKPGQIFMPQCGLAPGFIGVLGHHLSKGFDKIDEIKMRVGALPQFPTNHLKYNLTWSTDGLINEYCNPCEAVYRGEKIDVLPLEGLEHFSLDGVEYEAFNTSGGLGTLCETLAGRVNELNYKTVRYSGHQYLMDFIINGLKMGSTLERRKQLKEIMENALPITWQDVVLVFVSASGWKDGQYVQVTDARKVYHQKLFDEHWSSIQLTTAAGACAAIDLHVAGKLPNQGFVRQEDIDFNDFIANRFGQYYAVERSAEEIPA